MSGHVSAGDDMDSRLMDVPLEEPPLRSQPSEPMTEWEELQMRAHLVSDETLESTRRMLSLCAESEETGVKTLELIHTQGEQLDRIDRDMDGMNEDMRQTERTLTKMEKWCGLCLCPCGAGAGGRAKKFREKRAIWRSSTAAEKRPIVTSQPNGSSSRESVDDGVDNGGRQDESGLYILRVTNDAREDEMEENMGHVSTLIGNLRNMAIDMGHEIGAQNSQLDSINQKADSNNVRIQGINDRTARLAK